MSSSTTVTVADILELRADGLSEEEVWSILCQAVQTLQDLFLSDDIIHGQVIPLVTPFTLEISSKGRVNISLLNHLHLHHEYYLAPEYVQAGDKKPSELDWEKMWVYSLGRTLLSSLKEVVNVKTSSLLRVLRSMTWEDPSCRASLMFLLNVISEHCRTNLLSKPFSHLVVDMYREVFGTPPQCLSSSDSTDQNCVMKQRTSPIESATPSPNSPSSDSTRNTCSRQSSMASSVTSKTSHHIRRNPVQRAPSRLYRGPSVQHETTESKYMSPKTCIGPEFIVRSTEPPKTVHLGDIKAAQRRAITVILLTGQKIQITCDPNSITSGQVFDIVVQVEQLEDNYTLGLACLLNGDFVFLPSEMKLHKLAPSGWKDDSKKLNRPNFFLYLRVKFFLPSLRGIRHWNTKHLLYLQLRRSLLEQQIKCELKELLLLGGLALQAEFGNYAEEEHGRSDYFLLEHYLPEELIDEGLKLELQGLHKSRFGLDPGKAEEMFVAQVQRLQEYGSHHYTALWVRKSVNIPMWVTVNPHGIYLYEKKKNVLDRKIHEAFIWKDIQRLSYNKQSFHIVPHDVGGQKSTNYKLRMDSKKSFYLFRLASFHHQFFLKLRIELSSLHSLSVEFGIPLKRDNNTTFYVENKGNNRTQEWTQRSESYQERKISGLCRNVEETQNKENENPVDNKHGREKRIGVKMGVRAFHSVPRGSSEVLNRRLSISETSNSSSDAYVIDSSIKSFDDKFNYDLHETIPSSLADKFNDMSWEEERILRRVRLHKDKYGSFGLEVAEGKNGGIFIENVLKARTDEQEIDSMQKGDQLLSVNEICLLNMSYAEALSLLKNAGNEIEILISQSCRSETRQKPIEFEYLKNIRYDTAHELENFETEIVVTNVPTLEENIINEPFSTVTGLLSDAQLSVESSRF